MGMCRAMGLRLPCCRHGAEGDLLPPASPEVSMGLGGSCLQQHRPGLGFPVHVRELAGEGLQPPGHPAGGGPSLPTSPLRASPLITSHLLSLLPSPAHPPPLHPSNLPPNLLCPPFTPKLEGGGRAAPQVLTPQVTFAPGSGRSKRAGAGGPQSPSGVCRVATVQLLGTTCRHQIAFWQSSAAEKLDFPLQSRH